MEKQEKILSLLHDLSSEKFQVKINDLADLIERLNVSRRTIATWIENGILPHSRVGGKIWVTEAQLNAFLEQHSNEPAIRKGLVQKGGRK